MRFGIMLFRANFLYKEECGGVGYSIHRTRCSMARSAQDFAASYPGATVRELGEGLAVITFTDENMARLAGLAVEYVAENKHLLTYDREVRTPGGKAGKRHRGEGFFFSKNADVRKYKFGGTAVEGTLMYDAMENLLEAVNKMVPGEEFTAAFMVHYRDTNDELGFHADRDVNADTLVGVVAISVGQSRIFKVQPSKGSTIAPVSIDTKHGETLVMYGKGFQEKAIHAVKKAVVGPKNPKHVEGIQGRYSITFRRHMDKVAGKRKHA